MEHKIWPQSNTTDAYGQYELHSLQNGISEIALIHKTFSTMATSTLGYHLWEIHYQT